MKPPQDSRSVPFDIVAVGMLSTLAGAWCLSATILSRQWEPPVFAEPMRRLTRHLHSFIGDQPGWRVVCYALAMAQIGAGLGLLLRKRWAPRLALVVAIAALLAHGRCLSVSTVWGFRFSWYQLYVHVPLVIAPLLVGALMSRRRVTAFLQTQPVVIEPCRENASS